MFVLITKVVPKTSQEVNDHNTSKEEIEDGVKTVFKEVMKLMLFIS